MVQRARLYGTWVAYTSSKVEAYVWPGWPSAQAWGCGMCDRRPSHNPKGLATAWAQPSPSPAAGWAAASEPRAGLSRCRGGARGGAAQAPGLRQPNRVKPRTGPTERDLPCLWLNTTSPTRPSPWPRSSTHDSSSAFFRCIFLSANTSTSAGRLRRSAKVSPPCACTGAATSSPGSSAIGPRGFTARGVPVRLGVVRCRKERSALSQRGWWWECFRGWCQNVELQCILILRRWNKQIKLAFA